MSQNGDQLIYKVEEGEVEGCYLRYCGEIDLPSLATKIGVTAFMFFRNLTKVYLPPTISEIGACAFSGCENLVAVVDKDMTNPMQEAYRNDLTCIVLPRLVTKIEPQCFMECYRFENVIIPPAVWSIGEGAFFKCLGLKRLVIPNTVTEIGRNAFALCKNLDYVMVGRANYRSIRNDIPSGARIDFLD